MTTTASSKRRTWRGTNIGEEFSYMQAQLCSALCISIIGSI